jgi:hypothetical protein
MQKKIPSLVGADTLLKTLWPNEADRPSVRWLWEQQKKKTIPSFKLGKFVWFDPSAVAEALASQANSGRASR